MRLRIFISSGTNYAGWEHVCQAMNVAGFYQYGEAASIEDL